MKKPKPWYEKNLRINANHVLKVGDRVIDDEDNRGVVVLIRDWSESGPLTSSNHGAVNVLQDDGEEEHWCLYNWHSFLRLI